MNKKIKKIIFCVIFLSSFLLWEKVEAACNTACTKANTIYTCMDGSYDCVNDALGAASSGDTIKITDADANTWTSTLEITKPVSLKCENAGDITMTIGTTSYTYGLRYEPADPSDDKVFELSGCTFYTTGSWGGIEIKNQGTGNVTATRVKIHDNFIIHSSGSNRIFNISGKIRGVIYDNTLTIVGSSAGGVFQVMGRDKQTWDYETFDYGSVDNLYIEDNVINAYDNTIAGGAAKRWVFRYNTVTFSHAAVAPAVDAHGNTYSSHLGTIGVELYGNLFNISSTNGQMDMFGQRGGRAMVFYNQENGDVGNYDMYFYLWEEEPDWSQGASMLPATTCNDATDMNYGQKGCDTEGYPEHVNNSYYWNNRNSNDVMVNQGIAGRWTGGSGGTVTYDSTHLCDTNHKYTGNNPFDCNACTSSACDGQSSVYIVSGTGAGQYRACKARASDDTGCITVDAWDTVPDSTSIYEYRLRQWAKTSNNTSGWLTENKDFWNYNSNCTASACSEGIGCGLDIPLGTCTKGVGYWKRDENQSCTSTSGNVGANPTTPISGTLYKCTSTNTWEEYYTPYTYPHPLRGESDTIAPAAPTNLNIN